MPPPTAARSAGDGCTAPTHCPTDRLVADWKESHPGKTLTWLGYGRGPRTDLAADRTLIAALEANLLEETT